MADEIKEVDLWGNPIENPIKKDWTGDTHSVFVTVGASNHSQGDREENDFYATSYTATEWLCQIENLSQDIWEPCCGAGHISKVLESHGHRVRSTDLIYRGYGEGGINFLDPKIKEWPYDIVSNPPYKIAQEVVEKALEIIPDGQKVCMFLRVLFLEGQRRRALFDKYPPKTVWVTSKRIVCAKNGEFDSNTGGAQAYGWFCWTKGYKGDTVLKWFN